MVPEDHFYGAGFSVKVLFHMKATDAVCGFTFLRKEAAEQLLKVCSDDNGWFYTIEFLLRAERMYEEALGDRRKKLDHYITAFEAALKKGDHDEILETRDALNEILEEEDE